LDFDIEETSISKYLEVLRYRSILRYRGWQGSRCSCGYYGTLEMAGSLGPAFLLGDGVADTPDSLSRVNSIAGDRPGDLVIVLALVLVCIVFISALVSGILPTWTG
jgi:hypothetical protein